MADSTKNAADELEHEQIDWEQGDLAIKGFQGLIKKCDHPTNQGQDPCMSFGGYFGTLAITETTTSAKERSLDDLQSNLLPDLQRHLSDLSDSLKPSGLLEEFGSKIKQVLEIQLNLERMIDQIEAHKIILACHEENIPIGPNRVDDRDCKRLKSFRLYHLKENFADLSSHIRFVFREAYRLLRELKLGPNLPYNPRAKFTRQYLVGRACESIDCTVDWIKRSELDLAQTYWESPLESIDHILSSFRAFVDPRTHYRTESDEYLRQILVHKPVIQLAQIMMSLVKLSRLFFIKLSTRGMNVKRLASFTQMNSAEIKHLAQAPALIFGLLSRLQRLLLSADIHVRNRRDTWISQHDFLRTAHHLRISFDPLLSLVLGHLVPMIPDTDSGLPPQEYYTNWFTTWNIQRIIVTSDLLKLAQSFNENP
ncbi:hypothetical protein H4Q26_005317 [Puccinia striiformis f. sp. tritici PST-130]|nr:hypothetical protein H4Q26_005317 [Puccinia striiformis f. sp. tritici PST-130]